MSDQNNNKKSFTLPAYINVPFFLYDDDRLEKSSTKIAAFFYSLHTAGLNITASTDYLCALGKVHKRQLYKIMNILEECQYIRRSGFTNRKKIEWIYSPKSTINVLELDSSALQNTTVQELNTSAVQNTKLVHSRTLNLCTPVHTDNKEDTKDYKKLTTVNPNPSSSSFSEKQKTQLLELKSSNDSRSDELFLENCSHHVQSQINSNSKYQRFVGLKNILIKLQETGEYFKAKGLNKSQEIQEIINKIPTRDDFENYKRCVNGFEWVGAWMQKQKKSLIHEHHGRR